jgi:phage tail-like protein
MAGVMNPSGTVQRKTMSVVVLNDAGNEVGRYNLFGAYVSKYTGPNFEAKTDDIAFEEIEICYDYYDYIPI